MPSPLDEFNLILEAYKVGKDVKAKVTSFLERNKYGFTPNAHEASSLQRINESPSFQRLKECIGNHPSLNVIKLGMYIMELNDEGERNLIQETRDRISKKYGPHGMKIIGLGSTGVIYDIIEYLDNLKLRKGYGQEHLSLEFNKILDQWEKISIFVKSQHDQDELYVNIIEHMKNKFDIFFVFAYGSACDIAMKIIAELNNNGQIIQKNNYVFWAKPGKDRAGKIKYSWEFELCN